MNQKVVLIISIIIGILAFALSIQYFQKRTAELDRERQAFIERTRRVSVVVADSEIPEGMTVSKDDIGSKKVFELETEVHGAVVRADEAALLLGRKTRFKMKKGDVFYWSYIEGGQHHARGLAATITPGLRAISLSVSGAAAVSSMINPNDRVDVLGTFSFPSKTVVGEMESVTLTVLQDVTVLAVGQRLANQSASVAHTGRTESYGALTVEATPREAELLVFAQQLKGRLTMSLRNPTDVSYEKDLPSVNFESLEEKMPELNLYRQRQIRHKPNL